MEKTVKKEVNKTNKERVFDIKINKTALEKFMAKLFWYILITITACATILFVVSIGELVAVWAEVSATLAEAWLLIKMPFISLLVCFGWLGFIVLFIYLIRQS